jgi:hypothetical protein
MPEGEAATALIGGQGARTCQPYEFSPGESYRPKYRANRPNSHEVSTRAEC